MFEDRTYNNIMAEMLQEIPNNINKQEGSLIYHACAKQAVKLEEAYMKLAYIYDNILPDTQSEDFLIRYGESERGVYYNYATKAIVKGVFQQEIEIGERFQIDDVVYRIIEKIDDTQYNYRMECETEGIEGNSHFGEVEPVDYIVGFEGGEITEVLKAGKEEEDIEEYRKRVIESFDSRAYAGNRKAYIDYINQIDGVSGTKPYRREEGDPYIRITIIADGYRAPSQELIFKVQEMVDPEQNAGEGDGFANIGHMVLISGVKEKSINVSTNLTYKPGYSWEEIGSLITAAVEDYFYSLSADWINQDRLIVRIAQIEAVIMGVEGVIDIEGTAINGEEENLILQKDEIPMRGSVVTQ